MAEEKRREILHIAKTQQAAVQEKAPEAPERNEDAIQPAPTPELNPRNRAAAEIAARSNADRDAEAKETIPPGEEDAARLASEEQEPLPGEEPAPEPAPVAAAPETSPEAPKTPTGFDTEAEYEILVEGRPTKVRGSQILERGRMAIQKETAADYKLELASRLLREAEAKVPKEPQVPEKSYLDAAQAIQFGTTEQAAEVLKGFVSKAVSEAMQGATKVVPGMTQDQVQFQKAVDFVQSEYKDLMEDPYLKPVFFAEEQKRRTAGDTRSYTDLYKSIGEDLRKHFNRPKAVSAPAPTLTQRKEAKEQAPQAPKLASVRLTGGEAKKAPSREEIISGMRESRGMNALTKH
jgi:hypothetical protein